MRLMSDGVGWIGRLADRSPHPHLSVAALAFKGLDVCEDHATPVVNRPSLVAVCEGEALALVIVRQLEHMTSHTSRQTSLGEPPINGIDAHI